MSDPAAAATTAYRGYASSTADIANPDRGMYHYTQTRFRADGTGLAPLDAAMLTGWRVEDRITLVYRIFYLEKYAALDTIDARPTSGPSPPTSPPRAPRA